MAYHKEIVDKVKTLPVTLGVRLGRWAIYLDLPATKIARATGASRQTVYNWFAGNSVTNAYKPAVERVIKCMQSSKTAEEAWSKICAEFNLQD